MRYDFRLMATSIDNADLRIDTEGMLHGWWAEVEYPLDAGELDADHPARRVQECGFLYVGMYANPNERDADRRVHTTYAFLPAEAEVEGLDLDPERMDGLYVTVCQGEIKVSVSNPVGEPEPYDLPDEVRKPLLHFHTMAEAATKQAYAEHRQQLAA